MDIGHSRLLKFCTTSRPNMETHTLKIEDIAPTDIESEVPRQQKLRDDIPAPPPIDTVQNDQPQEWIDLRDMLKKPVYMGIQDDVIKTQPIRPPRDNNSKPRENDKTTTEDKPQTRIPVSRFKPVVERVQRERREKEGREQMIKKQAPEKPRRSSIPKLRAPVTRKYPIDEDQSESKVTSTEKAETPTTTTDRKPLRRDRIPVMSKSHYNIAKKDDGKKSVDKDKIDTNNKPNQVEQREEVQTSKDEKLDDEFDKLYEEIVDTDAGSLPGEILEIKVKDPEKLESTFEEIVHKYDEETVEQVRIEPVDKARYSKIPLLRRRSSHDVKIPKHFDRTLSLKIGDKSAKGSDEITNKIETETNDIDQKPHGIGKDYVAEDNDSEINHESSFEINNNDNNIEENDFESFETIETPHPLPAYNTIPTPEAERVKVGIFGLSTRDIPIEENTSQSLDVTTPVLETVKLAVIDIPAQENITNGNSYVETEESIPNYNIEKLIPADESAEDTIKSIDEPEIDKAEDNALPIESIKFETPTKIEEEIKNDLDSQHEPIKIATIKNDTIVQSDGTHGTLINMDQKNILTHTPNDELKSVGLLRKANSVEERTKSRYIMKPIKKEQDVANVAVSEEEIPMVKGKVSNILKRLTSHEYQNSKLGVKNDSNSNKEETVIKKELADIPRKKSVLSKIAMFERAEPEPPLPQKLVQRYSKPKRTISEEIRHSPKIVQEVLKPKGMTDKHTVVTIDVQKPVEIMSNSEEQVTIVENLPENTVVFDTADDNKQNEVELIGNRPIAQNISHEMILLDNKRLSDSEDWDKNTRKISVTRDRILDDDRHTSTPKDSNRLRVDELNESKDTRKISVTHNRILEDDLNETETNYTLLNDKPKELRQVSVTRDLTLEDDVEPPILKSVNSNIQRKSTADHQTSRDIIHLDIEPNGNDSEPKHVITKPDGSVEINSGSYIETITSNNPIGSESDDNITTDKHDYTKQSFKDKNEPTSLQTIKQGLSNQQDRIGKWKSNDALADFVPVKEKINRLTSFEDTKMKKAKSTAELDLGDAVKGKVKNMIVRMNSFELLDDTKEKEVEEVINVKERPRKRSVSEKIAMFEKKLTPVAMEDMKIDTGRSLKIDTKPVKNTVNSIEPANVIEEDYASKIKELKCAKMTYGSCGEMEYLQLRDGRHFPVLALGTALLEPGLTRHIVSAAIDLGYRAIDTAPIYGNEREVGEGVREKIQDGTVRREDLFIISKLWSTFHRPDLVAAACHASLEATGLEYFDLYLIHNPMSFKEGGDPLPKIANVLQFSSYDYLDAWFAMESLVAQGLVRGIGVSNFNSAQLARVLEKGRVKPSVNQVECHPYLSQQRLSDFCDARDIRMSCFGVLGSKGTPSEYKSTQIAVIDDPLVQVMAAGLGISPAQLLIRYQIDSGHSVVVKASTAAHLWDNLQALRTTLSPAQVAALHALNKNKRAFTFKGMGDTHRNYPFRIPF